MDNNKDNRVTAVQKGTLLPISILKEKYQQNVEKINTRSRRQFPGKR